MHSLQGNVEQPSAADTPGQNKEVVGDKAKIVGFSHNTLHLGSKELEINLLMRVIKGFYAEK